MNPTRSHFVTALICLLLGAGAVLFFQKYQLTTSAMNRASSSVTPTIQLAQAPQQEEANPFAEMQKMQEQMVRQFRQYDDNDSSEVKRREDKNFVYYDIAVKNVTKDQLKVKVADGEISVSGRVEKNSDDSGSGVFFRSSFHRSFPVPDDVDGNKVQLVQGKDSLTLRFPKLTARS